VITEPHGGTTAEAGEAPISPATGAKSVPANTARPTVRAPSLIFIAVSFCLLVDVVDFVRVI